MSVKQIFVDTSAWIEYLNKSAHPAGQKVEDALMLNTAVTSKVVLAELLQGAKSEKEVELIKDLPSVAKVLEEGPVVWQDAGLLANRLRKHGKTISLIDCYLAVLAKENKAAMLTLDKYFEVIGNYI